MGSNSMRKQRQAARNWKPPRIEALTPTQATYLDALDEFDCTIAVGPAGTGKTFVACSWAAQQYFNRNIQQIVLTRPVVGVGPTLGMLPGTLKKKIDPWAKPLEEAFKRNMSASKYEEAINSGAINIQAIEHVRGLTFDNAILIIDEAQNTTPHEMKALLTRIGENSRVIVSGDTRQSDLGRESGLDWVVRAVRDGLVHDVGLIAFTASDVVRSALCKMWGEAFDALEDASKARQELRF